MTKVTDTDCRLDKAKAFSGCAVVCDFCAHIHLDSSNIEGGATALLNLTRPGLLVEKPQVHILAQYSCSNGDEFGGLGIELGHGSVLIEYAKEEYHASSVVMNPDLKNPARIGIVFYQHQL